MQTRAAAMRCKCTVLLLAAMLMWSAALIAATSPLPVGSRVEFDKVYANNPALSQWVEGEITGYLPAQKYYKIRSRDGINYTVPNDPRWIRIVGTNPGGPSSGPGSPQPQENLLGPRLAPAPIRGGYAPGTHIQFDRVEAENPKNGRWDSGTVIERDAYNRYRIRGDNGVVYTIRNDPRWILPAGAPPPGPRHDYLDTPPTAPTRNANRPVATTGAMPPDGLYTVTNLGALHAVGELEIRGASYRGLEASGPFKALRGTAAALEFSGGLAGLEGCRITGANYMGLSKIGQPVIKIRYVSPRGFNEELEATKEH
jgi:hypothetical protein